MGALGAMDDGIGGGPLQNWVSIIHYAPLSFFYEVFISEHVHISILVSGRNMCAYVIVQLLLLYSTK